MIHQNHPGEGHVGYLYSTPYLCLAPYSEEDGPGIAWFNAQEGVTCEDCRKHPSFAQEEVK